MEKIAKNIRNFQVVIAYLKAVKGDYRPNNDELWIENLEEKLKIIGDYFNKEVKNKVNWLFLNNNRESLVIRVCTGLKNRTENINAEKNLSADEKNEVKKLIKEVNISIGGKRKSEVLAGENSIKGILQKQMTFEKTMRKLERIFEILGAINMEEEKSDSIDLANTENSLADLVKNNEEVKGVVSDLVKIDKMINEMMYEGNDSLIELNRKMKSYLKSEGYKDLLSDIVKYNIT